MTRQPFPQPSSVGENPPMRPDISAKKSHPFGGWLAWFTAPAKNAWLISYFRSGWAFFIPYLAAYLLYAWLKWPVNPAFGIWHFAQENGGSLSPLTLSLPHSLTPSFLHSLIPSLLSVYWLLHAIHLILAIFTLVAYWQRTSTTNSDLQPQLSELPSPNSHLQAPSPHHPTSELRSPNPSHSPASRNLAFPFFSLSVFQKSAPWLLLALIFYIPGIYLEWPSDPWEHLRRINEWHAHTAVLQHSSWYKSSYFLPYSLTGFTTGLTQLTWLNFYYTGICLLLSWQYYRLARAVGLGSRTSFIFVLLNALTFGNNIFSFYRYYGLSSSILAQIGAVALTRIALETFSASSAVPKTFDQRPKTSWPALVSSHWSLVPSALCLTALTAFNHIQGLGIAGLGILAVIVWRLIEWKRTMIGWLFLVAVLASIATILWFPRHPALDEIYRPAGWLTAWYGFNLFAPSSPAFDRSLQILNAFGVLNLFLGLWLIIRRNHVAGWMTLMPVIALALPCFALPFAQVLHTGQSGIVTFHRMLFAIPTGLSVAAVLDLYVSPESASIGYRLRSIAQRPAMVGICIALAMVCMWGRLSPGRFWHGLHVTPDDLKLVPYVAIRTPCEAGAPDAKAVGIDIPLASDVLEAFRAGRCDFVSRQSPVRLADRQLTQRLDWLANLGHAKLADAATSSLYVVATPVAVSAPWIVFSGSHPNYAVTGAKRSLANPRGQVSEIFSPDLIPIRHDVRYRLDSSLLQEGNSEAVNYLAVAWFDAFGRLLQSNVPQPAGAGEPLGWANGTYSYYGVQGQPSPSHETHYSITFGLGEHAEIPPRARYLRVGALLNYRATPGAKVTLSNVTLAQLPPPARFRLAIPDYSQLTTPWSISAHLSGHWSSSHVMAAQAGSWELHEALQKTGMP